MSVNKIIIVGRLGDNPFVRQAGTTDVAKLSVATNETWNDKDGKKQERTEWHNVEVWGKQANNCKKYLHKGSLVYVEGQLRTDKYEKDGSTQYATKIRANIVNFLDPRPDHGGYNDDREEEDISF